jgi:hypothetical protein
MNFHVSQKIGPTPHINMVDVRQPTADGVSGGLYLAAFFLFTAILGMGAIYNDSDNIGKLPYQVAMFLLCTSPVLLARNNPHHRLLVIFMVCYYMIFGMSNYFDVLFGTHTDFVLGGKIVFKTISDEMSKSDWVVIVGGLSFISGYFVLYRIIGSRPSMLFAKDWKPNVLFLVGLLTWLVGVTFSISYDMVVTPMHIPTHIMGIPLGIASNLRLLSPIAGLMLIYLAVKGDYKPNLVWMLLIAVISIEFILGFLANSKEISYRIPALLLLGMYFMHGNVNKKIIVVLFISVIPYMLFFNAYRNNVLMGARDQTQVEAVAKLDKTKDILMKSASNVEDVADSSLSSLKSRVNGKTYIDIIVAGIDSGKVDYQDGYTLTLFFKTFIPRMFWPEKPNNSIGQLFNQEFSLSESKYTFVPATQLGEMYWNFGMIGVVFGMMGIGMIFGFVASRFSVGGNMTLPRFLVLLLATYYLAVRFEGGFANQYSIFVRLVFLVAVLNVFIQFFGFSQFRANYSR